MGRICSLKQPISPSQAAALVKQKTGLSHVRLARAIDPGKNWQKIIVIPLRGYIQS